ncbi:prepilin-type N-terminal cleavage/methylation domain-containing protein [Corallococcus praedator]|uniref:Prepilin-type N-terminal cleavage/methylation domain-containing protein n=1 Tax=Corallococcus praedator TaxID=2316724 RepID=A0ABX9QJ06_9BACT|nr:MULTISPECIES: prepilin-type N-terminal cleavage/methylation domain-containing protein [Corallococcus]RKH30011.1 prepilin-type N-terminal cleavage/methylation domain-containing protein [Corallococcus sp. CA031C]RKI09354.1 prepilin-type N-terminal cleavage/methylation domain-containing protein [Corallococcus praedator]
MSPTSMQRRGFTLLEVMIASALGVIVLTTGLVVGTQMQKRALFEEQTMMAQVTGRAVKELFTTDLARAGTGMGNTPISFDTDDERSAITVWHKPDLTGNDTPLGPDPDFVPAPTEDLESDALQLYWGETNGMMTLAPCTEAPNVGRYRSNDLTTFCTGKDPSNGMVNPAQPTIAVLVSGGNKVACPVRIDTVMAGAPGKFTVHAPTPEVPSSPKCKGEVDTEFWKPTGVKTDVENWLALRLGGAAYRVNWKNNIPTLEYRAPGQAAWSVVSRDVEQMTVREGIIDLFEARNIVTWYPDAPAAGITRPYISECTLADFNAGPCKIDLKGADGVDLPAPATQEELHRRMRQRIRELEVTLVIRTRRINQDAILGGQDEEGRDQDGYKRRRFTFRILARNFAAVGMLRPVAKAEEVVVP